MKNRFAVPRRNAVLAAGIILGTLCAIAQEVRPELERPLSLFYSLNFEQALSILDSLVAGQPNDPVAKTWLAETYRRLGRPDTAAVLARQALATAPCSSFAHLVIAQSSFRDSDTVLAHVRRAVECDSTDPNGWLMMWGEAIREGEAALWQRTLHKLVETGFFTRAALAYGRAELRDLPPKAILLTNGDMDTYPAQAVQAVEGFRTDVAVIEREHLGIDWACRFIRDHQHIPLPVSDSQLGSMKDLPDSAGRSIHKAEQILRGWIAEIRSGNFTHPIALAPTVDDEFPSAGRNHFRDQGMFLLWQEGSATSTVDTAAYRRCLGGISPDDFIGPWTSVKDRSPIRRYYSNGIVRILFRIALTYSEALVKGGRQNEAEQQLRWLEDFERKTEVGYVDAAEIARLRDLMKE